MSGGINPYELEWRLRKLVQATRANVTLGEPRDDEDSKKADDKSTITSSETAEATDSKSKLSPQGKEAPKKFLDHDAGPRPNAMNDSQASGFTVGEPSVDENMEFCPWEVVLTYPTNFVGNTNRPHVQPYFDKIHEGRTWDFFYTHDVLGRNLRVYPLVPSAQFQAFLDTINQELDISLCIPCGAPAQRFLLKFGLGGTPRPRYLKRCEKNEVFSVKQWPPISHDDICDFMDASAEAQQAFNKNLDLLKRPVSDKKRSNKDKAARGKADREHTLAEVQKLVLPTYNEDQSDMIFIGIDFEALEQAPHPVSEVGISILDLKQVHGKEPGDYCRKWWPSFSDHHIRTQEYAGLVNHQYIHGCPDNFDFGTSIFAPKAKLPDAIMKILTPYIEAGRTIALVGHSIQQDITYLESIGIKISTIPSITRSFDTQTLHQAWRELDQKASLKNVLSDLGIYYKNLHNAGNDASFTLRAFFGIIEENIRKQGAMEKGEEYEPRGWAQQD